ncbi:MAG: 30S ribosomal protein S2 [Gemmatimonadales bacterium]|nr:30S ribosomal protein S2 [Gemmatimonadales bacterium]
MSVNNPSNIGLKDLLEAGVHFGHQTRKWNPKMKPYIFIARGGIYIIDLQRTLKALNKACAFLKTVGAKGGSVLFVGTKKQAKVAIREYAEKSGNPYVIERWLGGMLTNHQTIYKSVQKLEEIEAMMNDGRIENFSKKEQLDLSRKFEKLNTNLGGIRKMTGLPDAVFVVDTAEEETAVREANKLGIPVIGVVDTNCDPNLVTFPIPGNDDAIRAITLFTRVVSNSFEEGKTMRSEGSDQRVNKDVNMAEFKGKSKTEAAAASATLDGDAAKVESPAASAPVTKAAEADAKPADKTE